MKARKFEKYMGIGLMIVGAIGVVIFAKMIMDNNKSIKDTKEKAIG